MAVKQCPGHNRTPHVALTSEFGTNASRADGLAPYCKLCAASQQREWKRNHPDKVRENKRKYREKEKMASPCLT